MARTDPAGDTYGPEAFVFGECGLRAKNIKRTWNHACTVAGITDLHFHDLRHEAGSRLLEAGWQLHEVRDMLGHSNVSQTSTYLNAGRMGLQAAMRRIDASRCNSVASEPNQAPPLDGKEDSSTGANVLIN